MTHHYKNLLMNLPVRHTLDKIEIEDEKLMEQIINYKNKTITTFVILSR